MDKFLAKAKVDKRIYVHNDLENAAFYFAKRVEERSKKDDREGIGLEMMACLIMLAFAAEAQFNFLGFKLIKEWKEKEPALVKVHAVLKELKVDNDLKARPYKTIHELKDLRDMLAHGKPQEIQLEETVVATEEELSKKGALTHDYEQFLTEAFVAQACEDVDAIWKDLLKRADLKITDTITSGGVEWTVTRSA